MRNDEAVLSAAIVKLASEYGRYGYRRITELLRVVGWRVNAKRVQRIRRREGLKVPPRQPKRPRLCESMLGNIAALSRRRPLPFI